MIREDVCFMFCLPKTFVNNSERFAQVSCAEYVIQPDYKTEVLVRMLCVRDEASTSCAGQCRENTQFISKYFLLLGVKRD